MILVTGATGNVGGEVVRALRARRLAFRALVHSRDKAPAFEQAGIDVVVGSYRDPDALVVAMRGADHVFLVSPSVPDQFELERAAIDAACRAGVEHVVKLSAVGAPAGGYEFGRIHRRCEEILEGSAMGWTHLRANAFFDNLLAQAPAIGAQGAFVGASADGRVARVDVRDIAECAAVALTEPGHVGRTYDLTGPEALTGAQQAEVLSRRLGRTVAYVNLAPDVLERGMVQAGVDAWFAGALVDLERFLSQGGGEQVAGDVEVLTGHPARSFDGWVADHVEGFVNVGG